MRINRRDWLKTAFLGGAALAFSPLEILAASIRHSMHIINCAKIGADVITSPLPPILSLLKHPLTDAGLAQFIADSK